MSARRTSSAPLEGSPIPPVVEPPPADTGAGLDAALDAIVSIDVHGRVIAWNRAAEATFGYSRADAIGRPMADLIVPEHLREQHAAGFRRYLQTEETHILNRRIELEARRADGASFPVELSVTRNDTAGDTIFTAYIRDISARVQRDRRIAARTQTTSILAGAGSLRDAAKPVLRAVCENIGWRVGNLWVADRAQLEWVDGWADHPAAAAEFLEVSRRTTLEPGVGLPGRVWESGRPLWIADAADEQNFPRAPMAARAGLHAAFALPIVLQNEVLGVIEFFSDEIREPDQDLVETLSVIGSQIGQFMERRRAEEELRYRTTLLEAQSEAAIEGILVVDETGAIISFNQRFIDLWGIPDDVIAMRSDEAAIEFVRDMVVDPEAFQKRVRYLYEHPEETSKDEIRLRDGRVYERYSGPIQTVEGHRYGRVWFFRDVTEERRRETQLRFLADASEVLSSSLDYETTLVRLARLVVPHLADWCVVYLRGVDGAIERVVIEHVDPRKGKVASGIRGRTRLNSDARTGVPEVIRTGRSLLVPEATSEMIAADAADPRAQRKLIDKIGIRSWICVPLSARGRTFGAMSFVTAESGRRYGADDLAVAEDLARRAALVVDNVRLYQERDRIARTLQESLLPPDLPTVPGIELAASYLPAGEGVEVGGDFFDVFRTGANAWAVMIGDVCGKGPDAAAVMAMARYTLRAAAAAERRPSKILSALNVSMLDQLKDHRFVTVCFARVNLRPSGVRVTVSSGGHPLPLVVRADGRVERAGRPGTLLGVFEDPRLVDSAVELEPGDVMVLYTDGAVERRERLAERGDEALAAVLETCRGLSARACVDRIEEAALEPGGKPRRDDIAIVALRVDAPAGGRRRPG